MIRTVLGLASFTILAVWGTSANLNQSDDAKNAGDLVAVKAVSTRIIAGSGPETWVTQRTGYMGNTFGPNGFSSGSNTRVSRSKYPKS
jgi:hypothetical protein